MSERQILNTVKDFANTAKLAQSAGYDGVEIMGSEGYLINQFICQRTNQRSDKWGQLSKSHPLCVEYREVYPATSRHRVYYHFPSLHAGFSRARQHFDEVVELAKSLEQVGVTLINTGIGWHEARVPTIATQVPRAAFSWVTEK